MPKTLLRPCPICAAMHGDVVHSQRFAVPDELQVAESFDVVACTSCGFVFADTGTDQDVLDEVYEEHSKYADTSIYDEGQDAETLPEAPWDVDRLRATAAFLAEAVPDRSARLLDAGCATGTLLGFLGDQGFTNLVGLDPSPVATATAGRVHGVEAHAASFFSPPEDLGTFDVIVLSHVLEHLADVSEAARSLHRLLRPGGLAYLEVPDAPHYVDHLVAPFHDFNTEHINHFSPTALHRLLTGVGFEQVTSAEKVVMCAPTFTYPALYGLWRRVDNPSSPSQTNGDPDLRAGIDAYIAQSTQLLAAIDADLRARLDGEVIVWGAGQLAMKLLRDTVLAETPIAAVVDGSPQKQGLHLAGTLMHPPEVVKELTQPIVVTSIHHEESILSAIRGELGVDNEIVRLHRPSSVGG